jgi:hypothetical protein
VFGRIGGIVIIAAGVALVYVLAQPATVIDGRVYGPDVMGPAAIFGFGAVLVAATGPRPLDARLARGGMALLALGAFAVVAMYVIEEGSNPMAALTPLLIAIAAFATGGLAVVVSLLRSRLRPA